MSWTGGSLDNPRAWMFGMKFEGTENAFDWADPNQMNKGTLDHSPHAFPTYAVQTPTLDFLVLVGVDCWRGAW